MKRAAMLSVAVALTLATAAGAQKYSFTKKIQRRYDISSYTTAKKVAGKLDNMSYWRQNLTVGDRVRLGRHSYIDGTKNWAESMDDHVGDVVTIKSFGYEKKTHEPYVNVYGNSFVWRVRNLRKPSSSTSSYSSSSVSRIKDRYDVSSSNARKVLSKLNSMYNSYWKKNLRKGDRVRLGRHTEIDGKKNWSESMSKSVGDIVEIKSFGYESGNGYEPYVRVHDNSYVWRVRNLRKPATRSASYSSSDIRRTRDKYDVSSSDARKILDKLDGMSNSSWKKNLGTGDRVRLGRHTEIDGKKNWSEPMSECVGDVVEIKGFGYESSNKYEPYVRVHGNSFVWRVRNLRKSSSSSYSSSYTSKIRSRYSVSSARARKIIDKLNGMSNSYWKKNLKVGSRVRLGRHTMIGGTRFWSSGMDDFIGDIVTIKSFTHESSNDYEPCVRVRGNSYAWRVRNLRKP
jgi:hypothetical protein